MYLVSSDDWDSALNGIDEVGLGPAFFVIFIRVLKKVRRKRKGQGRVHLEQRIEEIIELAVQDLGFEVVRVQLSGNQNPRLQIMAEPIVGDNMTIDHCATISRMVSAILDVDDPIGGAYTLEVSSPGLDRPLMKIRDFERFAGFEARIETNEAVDGRKRFRGRLSGVEGENITIEVDGEDMSIPHLLVLRAKLLVTNDLLTAQDVTG